MKKPTTAAAPEAIALESKNQTAFTKAVKNIKKSIAVSGRRQGGIAIAKLILFYCIYFSTILQEFYVLCRSIAVSRTYGIRIRVA
jgi:hypothetical protein